MNCSVSVENQKSLRVAVMAKLNDITENKKPFDLKEFLTEYYNTINNRINDEVKSLDYVRLIPRFIQQAITFSDPMQEHLLDNGLDLTKLARLSLSFDKSLDNVSEYLSLNKDLVKEAAQVSRDFGEIPQQPLKGYVKVPDQFKAVSPSFLVTTSNDAISTIENSPNYNVVRPSEVFYINVRNKILDILTDKSYDIEDGVNLPGVGRVYLKMMRSSQLPNDQLRPDVDPESEVHKKGVVVAIVDSGGSYVRFSDSGEVDYNGKIAYYVLPKADDYFVKDKDGNVILDKDGLPKDFYDFKNRITKKADAFKSILWVTPQEALEVIKEQLLFLYKMRQYIGEDVNNSLMLDITGGSKGYAHKDYKKPNPLKELAFDHPTDFKPWVAGKDTADPEKGIREGFTYFNVPDLEFPIEITKPAIMPDEIRIMLINLLSQNIKMTTSTGSVIDVDPATKYDVLKTYINTGNKSIELFLTDTGYDIRIKGKLIPKDSLKQELTDYFSNPSDSSNRLQIRKDLIDNSFNNSTIEQRGGELYLVQKPMAYNEFIRQNMNIDYELNGQKKISLLNGHFIFSVKRENFKSVAPELYNTSLVLKVGEEKNFEIPEEVKTDGKIDPAKAEQYVNKVTDKLFDTLNKSMDKKTIQDLLDDTANSDEFNKLGIQKRWNKEVTAQQILDAKKWYEASPLSKHIPFHQLFATINTKNPKSIANWAIDGIRLFKGSDYTDLYHEAWHGFTQTFLSKEDKINLYKEVKKLPGSFRDYNGDLVSFVSASYKQLEEFLAEDFRQFMLSDGKKTDTKTPVKNNIFRRIYNFLKGLFFGAQVDTDPMSIPMVKEFYDKLRIGDLSQWRFNSNNTMFGELAQTVRSTNADDKVNLPQLGYEDSRLINESVDSIISEYIDKLNNIKNTKRFTNTLLRSEAGIRSAYQYVFLKFKDEVLPNLNKQYNETNNEILKGELQYSIDLTNYILRNFGDVNNIHENVNNQNGIIYYHLLKSRLLSEDDKMAILSDELSEEETYTKFDKAGNELSLREMASKEIVYILRGIYKTEKNQVVNNRLGIPQLADFDKTWNMLARELAGTISAELMYKKLVDLTNNGDKVTEQILKKLGDITTNDSNQQFTWTNFWQTFNKSNVPLIQMTLEEKTIDDVTGDTMDVPTYKIKIGQSSAVYRQVGINWKNHFLSVNNNKYIKEDKNFNNYLDINALLKAYPNIKKVKENPIKFLRDLGIPITNNVEIIKRLLSGTGGLTYIHSRLYELRERNADIKDISDIFKEYKADGKNPRLSDNNTRFKQLQELEARYSDNVSNFMVSNAEGNIQYEHTLNNTLTILSDAINKVASYEELISLPYMSYLDIKRNPFARNSIWLNSLFDMSKPEGFRAKRIDSATNKPVELNVQNLSGVSVLTDAENSSDNGIASAKADEFTKIILDFHLATVRGTPELMRHSDKGSSFSVYISKLITNTKTGLYIDSIDFLNRKVGENVYMPARDKAFNIVFGYIDSERTRINMISKLEGQNIKYDFNYIKNGKKFSIFDDILSDEVKSKLLSIPENITLTDYFQSDEKGLKLKNEISSDLLKYFRVQIAEARKLMNKAPFIADSVIDDLKKLAINSKIFQRKSDITNNVAIDALIKSFVFNSWIHNVESLTFIYGDLAQYNMEKEEFHKRNAGSSSTGEIFRSDNEMIRYANDILKRPWASKIGYNEKKVAYDGTLDSGVLEDVEVGSAYIEEYTNEITKYYTERYKDKIANAIDDAQKKYLTDELNNKIKNAIKPYQDKEMEEGNAQGWITFDAYRILLSMEGKWSKEQEQLFQKIVKGEDVNAYDIVKFFPVKKLQYYGQLKTDYLPIVGFHKFSLLPLIPNVIKGTNLEKLHNRMMKNEYDEQGNVTRTGIDYALFQSGSKVSTITNDNKKDAFYSDLKSRVLDDSPITPNPIYLNYLKDQLDTGDKFKGKITFSTQMRKLIEDGLVEGGVPTDFEPNEKISTNKINKWEALPESDKLKYKNYRLLKEYEKIISDLTEKKKQNLLKRLNWSIDSKGNLVGNIKDLLNYVVAQLSSRDLAEHEIDFIKLNSHGQLEHDLSLSYSSENIEKLLNALVTKELIKQKINGEGLILASGSGFEKYTNPSSGDLNKYGTNDLPTYHKGKDGNTTAMKVKVAIQGDFRKLLSHSDVKALANSQNISRLEALNRLIKDDNWLNKEDNRKLVTMVGTRIPVQGLNSMEFMEVYEFLPITAGNIIIPPSDIVAKSGSDYDIDKLFVMMPSITNDFGNIVISKRYSEKTTKDLYEKLKRSKLSMGLRRDTDGNVITRDTLKLHRTDDGYLYSNLPDLYQYNKLIQGIFGIDLENLDDELIKEILTEENMPSYDEFNERINGTKSIENDLIFKIKEILEQPDNYVTLIRPNGVDIVQPLANELGQYVSDYDQFKVINGPERKNKKGGKMISSSRVLELGYNLFKHQTNNIGKQVLGIGAVDNTYNVLFNRVGARLNASYFAGKGTRKYRKRQVLLLPHNTYDSTTNINGIDIPVKDISLSHVYDVYGDNKISDVISQLINGWVDIAKDPWIFNIQGNKELTPSLLFMIQAGVPFKTAVYFLSQPLIREYVNEQRLAKSTFNKPLGKDPGNPNFFRVVAKRNILSKYVPYLEIGGRIYDSDVYKTTVQLTKSQRETAFDVDRLYNKLKEYGNNLKSDTQTVITNDDIAVFLHYLEIEGMAKAVGELKFKTNVDTNKSSNLFEALKRELLITMLSEDQRFPKGLISDILGSAIKEGKTPITSLFIQRFQQEIWNDLFKIRNHPELNKFLFDKFINDSNIIETIDSLFGDEERFASEFRNDFVSFIYQNELYNFDLDNLSVYNGYSVHDMPAKNVRLLTSGVSVLEKDGVKSIYYSKDQLKKDWLDLKDRKRDISIQPGLNKVAEVIPTWFKYARDYYKFVFERETLRSLYPLSEMSKFSEYKDRLDMNLSSKFRRVAGDSDDLFYKKMEKLTYEEMLRDMALDNVFNPYKIFKSKNSFADQFEKIKNKYPDLKTNYGLIQAMGISISQKGTKNLKINNIKMDMDTIEQFHQNILELSNPSKIRVKADPADIQMITRFFNQLQIFSFLQSGLNTRSSLSLIRIMPQDKFLNTVDRVYNNYVNNLNSNVLEEYYKGFINVNKDYAERNRFKNYSVPKVSFVKRAEDQLISELSTDSAGNVLYLGNKSLTPPKAKSYAESNPNVVFVFNDSIEPLKGLTGGANKFDWSFREAKKTFGNIIGLPTRKNFGVAATSYYQDVIDKNGYPQVNPIIKKAVDETIATLKAAKQEGKTLAFNSLGYGQYLIAADDSTGIIGKKKPLGTQTFIYLSEQLAKEFGFINPNFENLKYPDLVKRVMTKKTSNISFQEDKSNGYRERTIKNASADITIAIAVDFNSAGEKLTKSSVLSQNKKYVSIDANKLVVTKERVDKLVEILNSINKEDTNIYSKLGNKTASKNVVISKTPWKANIPNSIVAMRSATNLYGNPFSPLNDTTQITNKVNTPKDAVIAFIEWLTTDKYSNIEPERRNKLISQLKSGELKGKTIVYYKEANAPMHSTALDYLINKYDWNNQSKGITLNIAGNGIYTMKGKYSQKQIDDFTYDLLKAVIESPNLKTKIISVRTGGQTGFDEAGAKAANKLGIPTIILAPKGWKFRNIFGEDIANETAFKERFTEPITEDISEESIPVNKTGKSFVQENQEVSDEDVLAMLKHCMTLNI